MMSVDLDVRNQRVPFLASSSPGFGVRVGLCLTPKIQVSAPPSGLSGADPRKGLSIGKKR